MAASHSRLPKGPNPARGAPKGFTADEAEDGPGTNACCGLARGLWGMRLCTKASRMPNKTRCDLCGAPTSDQ